MDSQQTPRSSADLAASQNPVMVKQGPPPSTYPLGPQQVQALGGPPPGPRFPPPPNSNGPTDGSVRFQQQPTGPPPLRHLDSRSQLNPGQFAPPRPPYGPGGPPQRAPPPRNVFFGRSPQPGSPSGGPPSRFPPAPGPQGQPQFQGQPPQGPRPVPYGHQGISNRPPFQGPPSGDPRAQLANRNILQRTDSVGAPPDPRFVRQNYPPDPRLLQHQQQLIAARRGQLRPQMSVDSRMAEVEERAPSSASLKNEEVTKPKSAISENGKSSDSENEENKLDDQLKSSVLEHQNNAKNTASIVKTQTEVQPVKMESRPQSAVMEKKEQTASNLSLPITEPRVTTPSDSSSIKGFDDGQRKSLSSPKSPSQSSPKSPSLPSPKSPAISSPPKSTAISSSIPDNEEQEVPGSEKKKATFADEKTSQAPSNNIKTGSMQNLASTKNEGKGKTEPRMMRKSSSARSIKTDAENDSGVDESTQRREMPKSNGLAVSPSKKSSERRSVAASPIKSPSKSVKSLPKTPDATPSSAEKKKVPMNKIQVGAAPSPNLKVVRSKIGSLENATHKPGGGKIKIENRKLDFSNAQPKIAAKNDKYMPSGGDKKIQQVKLQWNAKPKIGSLENATYKPGGGDKKIETVKLDFKEKAKPKVGSKENAKHVPGGGTVKSSATPPKTPQDKPNNIETQKLDIKAESKVGSMDNVKYKPGGGDKKIFDDKTYLRQKSSSNVGSVTGSATGSGSQSPIPSHAGSDKNGLPISDENLNREC